MFRYLAMLSMIASLCAACSTAPPADAERIRVVPVAERGAPVRITGEDLSGRPYDPDPAATATVVNVWTSSCAPCRHEAPLLADVARRSPAGVRFVGIDVRESGRGQAQRFEKRFDVPYPSVYDPGGSTLIQFDHVIPLAAVPSTVILDRELRVAAVVLGSIPSRRTLVDLIEEVREQDGTDATSAQRPRS